MKMLQKVARVLLMIETWFLAITGFAGGIGLLAGLNAPPVENLKGSIFKDFTIPGLALFVFVGGGALLAAILLTRKNKFSVLFSTVSGIIIMCFEFVEVLAIGSPAGVAQVLQLFYFGLGLVITVTAIGIWFVDISSK